MKNKKAQSNGNVIGLYIVLFILSAIVLVFVGHLAIWLGIASLIICFILFASGSSRAGVSFLIIGLVLLLGGIGITNFFNNNEVGQLWIGSGKTIVNSTAESYKITKGALP